MALAVKGSFLKTFTTEDASVDKILWMDYVHPQSKFVWPLGHQAPIIIPESGRLSLRVSAVAAETAVGCLCGFTLEESRLRYRALVDAAVTITVDGNFHTIMQVRSGSGCRIAVLDFWIAFSGVSASAKMLTCQLARTSGTAGSSTSIDSDYVEILNADEVGA